MNKNKPAPLLPIHTLKTGTFGLGQVHGTFVDPLSLNRTGALELSGSPHNGAMRSKETHWYPPVMVHRRAYQDTETILSV